jgi:hypothetical protein
VVVIMDWGRERKKETNEREGYDFGFGINLE